METATDELLTRAACGGDSAAYGELFARYRSRIYNYAYGIAGNTEDAADIAQEAFVRVFEALSRLTGELNFSAYLYRTAHNLAINTVKGRSRFEAPDALDVQMEPSLRADPERVALVQEQQDQAWTAAFRLSDNHRAILTLRELHDLSYQDIADILGMPRNTVGVLLSRARLKFKEAFRMSSIDIEKLTAECRDMLPLLSAYLDDELDTKKRARVDAHLEQCAFCRLALEEMTESSRSYRALLPLLPPAALGEGVWNRLGDLLNPQQATAGSQSEVSAPPQSVPASPAAGLASTTGAAEAGTRGKSGAGRRAGLASRRSPLRLAALCAGGAAVILLGVWLAVGSPDWLSGSSGASTPSGAGGAGATTVATAPLASSPLSTLAATLATTGTILPETTVATTGTTAGAPSTGSTATTVPPDTTAPPTPTIIYPSAGTSVTSRTISLQWQEVKDPSGVTYRVEIQSFNENTGAYEAADGAEGITDTNMKHTMSAPRERWRVTTVDGAGNESAPSAWAKYAFVSTDQPPTKPSLTITTLPVMTTITKPLLVRPTVETTTTTQVLY